MHHLYLENLQEIESLIGYKFKNPLLLSQALTHSSYANENAVSSNERMEFLGDVVIGFVVSDYLYSISPELDEAEMSQIRAELVNKKSLSFFSRSIELGRFLFLGKGEKLNGGQDKDSILADAIEALTGAIYLDGGLEPAKKFLMRYISEKGVGTAIKGKMD
jgi:ribonuclease-3